MAATEEELMRSLQTREGDDAIRALYRLHGAPLYGFALNRLRDHQLAEELVQEVFTRVWRRAEDFDPERGSFRTWLYGIARNAVVDLERRRAVRPRVADEQPHAEAAEEPLEQALLRWQVQAALEQLAPHHREVIHLAHFEGLKLREIAERTGLPVGTVKSRASYALSNLRLALEEMGVEP